MLGFGQQKKRCLIRDELPLTGMDLIKALSMLHVADTASIQAGNRGFSAKISVMISGRVVEADVFVGGVPRFGADDFLWRLELSASRSVSDWELIQAGDRLLDALMSLPRRPLRMEPMPEVLRPA